MNDVLKSKNDKPSIGILLCKTKESIEVEYALRNIGKPIGISEFTFTETLPKNLKSSLPSVGELEDELRKFITKKPKESITVQEKKISTKQILLKNTKKIVAKIKK